MIEFWTRSGQVDEFWSRFAGEFEVGGRIELFGRVGGTAGAVLAVVRHSSRGLSPLFNFECPKQKLVLLKKQDAFTKHQLLLFFVKPALQFNHYSK